MRIYYFASCLLLICSSNQAAVVLDGSMGSASTLDGPHYQITEQLGKTAGSNLFHSFSQFNLSANEKAIFSHANPQIQNIFARVTGGNPSLIDGGIESASNANLWLINPGGIQFGPNSRLDIGGSLYLSSADYLKLADGNVFHARSPQQSVLTAAAPQAFGFLDANPQAIVFNGMGADALVKLPKGQSLTIAAGDILFNNATQLTVRGGAANLFSSQSAGEVNVLTMQHNFSQGGTISLEEGSALRLLNPAANSTIFAKNLSLSGLGSELVSLSDEALEPTQLSIQLEQLNQGSGSWLASYAFEMGRGMDIHIQADSVSLQSAMISAIAYEDGRAGDVTLNARQISLQGDTLYGVAGIGIANFNRAAAGHLRINSDVLHGYGFAMVGAMSDGTGQSAQVILHTKELGLFSQAEQLAVLGNRCFQYCNNKAPGNIFVQADHIILDGPSSSMMTSAPSDGMGGNIEIQARKMDLLNGGAITSDPQGEGMGGDIVLNVDTLNLRQGFINSSVTPDTSGKGGNITINSQNLSLSEKSGVMVGSFGLGQSGNIDINNQQTLTLDDSQINASNTFGLAQGLLSIKTDALFMNNNAGILGGTRGPGMAANVDIQAKTLQLNHSRILGLSTGAGAGANIAIQADNVMLLANSSISSTGYDSGNAGNIQINAAHSIELKQSAIKTEAINADGGNIVMNAPHRIMLQDSKVTTSVYQYGAGGNIQIDPEFVILQNSKIIAQAFDGPGGNIQIQSQQFIATPDSLVDASSQRGVQGQVDIQAPNDNVTNRLPVLSNYFIDPTSFIKQSCAERYAHKRNSLALLPPLMRPNDPAQLQQIATSESTSSSCM